MTLTYRKRMEAATSTAELERIRSEHRAFIRERAMLLGIEPPADP